jgi:hypothetical protein
MAMERSKQLAAMVLLSAFVVGLALGLTWQRTAGASTVPAYGTAAVTPDPDHDLGSHTAKSALDAFSEELQLSDAQRASVDSILDERHRIIDSLVAPMHPQIEAARESARAQIRRRLGEAQQQRFDAYLERVRQAERHAPGTR